MLQLKTSCVLSLLLIGVVMCWLGCGQQATPEKEAEKGTTAGTEEQIETTIIKGNIRLPGKPSSAGVMVFLSGTSALAFTNDNGDFTIENVPPGDYEVFAQKPGYKFASLGKIKAEGGSTTLPPFSLEELPALEEGLCAIIGNVELEGTTDHSNVIVEIEEQLIRTVTDENGVYFIPNLSPGAYNLRFKKSGYKSTSMQVEVKAGPRPTNAPKQKMELLTKLPGKRAIYGKVEMYDIAGKPQNKFSTVIVALEGTTNVAVPDSTGKFSLLNLPPDKYTITATAPGFINRNKIDVDLTNLPFTNVTLILDEDLDQAQGKGKVHGRVVLADKTENFSGITVGLLGTNIMALTKENGEFTLTNVPENLYTLIAKFENYVPAKVESVLVAREETTEVGEIKLERAVVKPRVLFTSPPNNTKNVSVKREIPVFIWFSKKMRPDSVKAAVSITPKVDAQLFAGKEHPQSDFDILLIMLKGTNTENPVKFAATYQFKIDTTAVDVEGASLEEPYEFRFTTGEAEIIDTRPRQGERAARLSPQVPILIYFNAPVDPQTCNPSNIQIQPELMGGFDIYAREDRESGWTILRLRSSAWEPDKDYTITLGSGLRTMDGSRISNTPYQLRFHTAPLYEYTPPGE